MYIHGNFGIKINQKLGTSTIIYEIVDTIVKINNIIETTWPLTGVLQRGEGGRPQLVAAGYTFVQTAITPRGPGITGVFG